MKQAEIYRNEFILQTKKDMEILNSLYSSWKSTPGKGSYLQDIMRISHSIKSGASFLHMEKIEIQAHQVESCVAEALKVRKINKQKIIKLDQGLKNLMELVQYLESPEATSYTTPVSTVEKDSSAQRTYYLALSSFDKKLLTSGWKKGERFFRIDCHLDPEEPMKYARAYLINANLEACSTVIKCVPSLDDREEDFSTLSLFITTDLPEGEIRSSLNIDRIHDISVTLLDWKDYISEEEVIPFSVKKRVDSFDSQFISIETNRIEDLRNFAEALRVKLDMLHPATMGLDDLRVISASFSRVLDEVTLVPLFSVLNSFPSYITEIGAERGKLVQMDITGGDYALDRTRLNSLATALQHLLRNAVGHGIELPEDRSLAGKAKEGHIVLSINREGDQLILDLSDDGKGIDKKQLFENVKDKGIAVEGDVSSFDPLEVLSLPGFSTSDTVTSLSGRGVCLENALHLIRDVLGGTITMDTAPGKGVSFHITVPESGSRQRLLIFRKGKHLFALPARNINRSFPLNLQAVRENRQTGIRSYQLYGEFLPLFMGNRPCSNDDKLPSRGYAVLFRQSGKRGVVVADELIMEKEYPKNLFCLRKQLKPFLYSVEIDGEPGDFYYLSPTVLG